MEPRLKKKMEGGAEPPKKKTMYLRLGYRDDPKKRETKRVKKKSECRGGKQHCRGCKSANIISPETLLRKESAEKPGAEAIAPLFEGIKPKDEDENNPCEGSICDACNECD